MIDFLFSITHCENVDYDIESYPNVFTFTALHGDTKTVFEISNRKTDIRLLCLFLLTLRRFKCKMIGFNNLAYDYPVLHFIFMNQRVNLTAYDIYKCSKKIINTPFNRRFDNMIRHKDWIVDQIDLYKIHHFDNPSKATSLKIIEFNMIMQSVEDLPFPVESILTHPQIDVLLDYNHHDVIATRQFRELSQPQIKLREDLSRSLSFNVMNASDVKIGEIILINELEKQGVECYTFAEGRKRKKQTIRDSINLADVIFNNIAFERPEFQTILDYFKSKTITETKGVFKGLSATVQGLNYHFGTGGLHASVESQTVRSDEQYQLIDVDVASYYPNLAIVNKLFPAHLGEKYCDAYLEIYKTRKTFKKGTAENEAFKLALNGAYGGSNNKYSPFFDSQYTMSITINGQLLLCMLAEQMLKTPGLKMVQCNTDGITYLCPHEYIEHTKDVCGWWEQLTGLELESVMYDSMHIRDVNNYIAVSADKVKRIGAYAYETAIENPGTRELPHHKNWSARIVAMVAEDALVYDYDIKKTVPGHFGVYDFLLRTKVPRNSYLELGGEIVPNIIRYYISKKGQFLEKVMPPAGPEGTYKRANGLTDQYYNQILTETGDTWDERIHTKNKSIYEERRIGIHTGQKIKLCNNLDDFDPSDIDYDWYIKEAEKLVNPLRS